MKMRVLAICVLTAPALGAPCPPAGQDRAALGEGVENDYVMVRPV